MIDRSELLEYFLSEAEDHIITLEKGIYELEASTDKPSLIEDIFRAAHTLKGSAALVNLTKTSTIAHRMEDILEGLMNKKIKATGNIVELLSFMLDGLKALISRIAKGSHEILETEQAILLRADEVLLSEQSTITSAGLQISEFRASSQSGTVQQKSADAKRIQLPVAKEIEPPSAQEIPQRRKEDAEFFMSSFIKVDSQKIEDMLTLIGEVTIKKNYLLQKTKNIVDISDEIFFTGRRLLMEVNDFAERYAYSLPENVKYIDPLLSEFGELEFDRYDELNLFSRKLQEITNDVTESLKELNDFFEHFGADIKSMDTMIKLLKASLTDSRMMDIGILLKRFARPVKDMARLHNKKVELIISGGLTKIDRVIFERLFNPLMHLIMNSISHGIERIEERLQKNKKPEGTVTLAARKEGGIAVIEVIDDGRGIDSDSIFKKAVKQGLLSAKDKPSKDELISLIFLPGFSTAERTDMTSGRGIGMSAVRRMIAGINGVLEVSTEAGRGTTVRIKVPLSLAISNVILFRSGMLDFVMPTSFVEEVMQLADSPENGFMDYRGKKIIAKEFADILGVPSKPGKSNNYVIICNVTDKKVGLIVDEVIGHEETVIKPMNSFLEGLQIYSGTTISGDGSIRFVINPITIFEEQIQPLAALPSDTEDYTGKRVLIVDDSLSVRKYVSFFFETRKFKVYTASNGVEALNILYEMPVDMIITDLEMPVMHGYEFMSRVKSSEMLKNIPIVVLTSRSGEKHKEKAAESGVEDYLIKPFDDKALIDILRKYFILSFA